MEEEGGFNLYGFVGNDPIGKWDLLGLEWIITRDKSENWAVAKPENSNDSFQDLADLLKLDHAERTKWLKASTRNFDFVTDGDEADTNCEYKIPNTVVVYTSKQTGIDTVWWPVTPQANVFRRMAIQGGRNYEAKNYKVLYELNKSSEQLFKDLWETDGIFAFAFGGHGAGFDGDWYGFMADPDGEGVVGPDQVNPPYKLQAVGAYSCGSANDIIALSSPMVRDPETGVLGSALVKWKNLVNLPGGTFIGYFGAVNRFNVVENQESINPREVP